jgi:hypothetical protein
MRGTGWLVAGLLTSVPWAGAHGQRPEYDPHRITAIEIQSLDGAKTAWDVVKALRPQFLRPRPSGSVRNRQPVPIAVYVDGVYRGGTEVLTQLQANAIAEILWLSGTDATTRFGTNHESGAILVSQGVLSRPPS